jgi:hypothetical protein
MRQLEFVRLFWEVTFVLIWLDITRDHGNHRLLATEIHYKSRRFILWSSDIAVTRKEKKRKEWKKEKTCAWYHRSNDSTEDMYDFEGRAFGTLSISFFAFHHSWIILGEFRRDYANCSLRSDQQAWLNRLEISIFVFRSSWTGISSLVRKCKKGVRRRPAYRFLCFARQWILCWKWDLVRIRDERGERE